VINPVIQVAAMKAQFLATYNLELFLDCLRHGGELHAPQRGADGALRFAPLAPGTMPELNALRTVLPTKKYLLHPCETILTYTSRTGYQFPEEATLPLVVLGLHPCDLAAIAYLDRIFLGADPDILYAERRAALTVIGVSCLPDEFCSCHRTPSPLPASADLFMRLIDGGSIVTSGSSRGDALLGVAHDVVSEYAGDIPEDTRRFFGRADAVRHYAEPDAQHPEWQELADHCLGCGACSICCPTCACFDVLEFGGLDGDSAQRIRQWDNCLFKGHAQISGGMSFRKSRADRFRYRYQHKYRGFGALRGIPACVGCGRCRIACPAGLDLRPLAERLEREPI
jgi:ferredoxin